MIIAVRGDMLARPHGRGCPTPAQLDRATCAIYTAVRLWMLIEPGDPTRIKPTKSFTGKTARSTGIHSRSLIKSAMSWGSFSTCIRNLIQSSNPKLSQHLKLLSLAPTSTHVLALAAPQPPSDAMRIVGK